MRLNLLTIREMATSNEYSNLYKQDLGDDDSRKKPSLFMHQHVPPDSTPPSRSVQAEKQSHPKKDLNSRLNDTSSRQSPPAEKQLRFKEDHESNHDRHESHEGKGSIIIKSDGAAGDPPIRSTQEKQPRADKNHDYRRDNHEPDSAPASRSIQIEPLSRAKKDHSYRRDNHELVKVKAPMTIELNSAPSSQSNHTEPQSRGKKDHDSRRNNHEFDEVKVPVINGLKGTLLSRSTQSEMRPHLKDYESRRDNQDSNEVKNPVKIGSKSNPQNRPSQAEKRPFPKKDRGFQDGNRVFSESSAVAPIESNGIILGRSTQPEKQPPSKKIHNSPSDGHNSNERKVAIINNTDNIGLCRSKQPDKQPYLRKDCGGSHNFNEGKAAVTTKSNIAAPSRSTHNEKPSLKKDDGSRRSSEDSNEDRAAVTIKPNHTAQSRSTHQEKPSIKKQDGSRRGSRDSNESKPAVILLEGREKDIVTQRILEEVDNELHEKAMVKEAEEKNGWKFTSEVAGRMFLKIQDKDTGIFIECNDFARNCKKAIRADAQIDTKKKGMIVPSLHSLLSPDNKARHFKRLVALLCSRNRDARFWSVGDVPDEWIGIDRVVLCLREGLGKEVERRREKGEGVRG